MPSKRRKKKKSKSNHYHPRKQQTRKSKSKKSIAKQHRSKGDYINNEIIQPIQQNGLCVLTNASNIGNVTVERIPYYDGTTANLIQTDIPIDTSIPTAIKPPKSPIRLYHQTIRSNSININLPEVSKQTLNEIISHKKYDNYILNENQQDPFWNLFPHSYRESKCKQFHINDNSGEIKNILFDIAEPDEIGVSLRDLALTCMTQMGGYNAGETTTILCHGQFGDFVYIDTVGAFILGAGALNMKQIQSGYLYQNNEKDYLRLIQLVPFKQQSTLCLPMEVNDAPIGYYDNVARKFNISLSNWCDVKRFRFKNERWINIMKHIYKVSRGTEIMKTVYVPQLLCGKEIFIPDDYVILDKGNKKYVWMIKKHAINCTPLYRVYIDEYCKRFDDAQILRYYKIKAYLQSSSVLTDHNILDEIMSFLLAY